MSDLKSIESELRDLRSQMTRLQMEHSQLLQRIPPAANVENTHSHPMVSTVVGGSEAPEFEDCAAVGRTDIAGFYGSGVLAVNPSLVITAAHCGPLGGSSLPTVVALKAATTTNLAGAEVIAGTFVGFPGYTMGGPHDIAVMKLVNKSTVTPIALATTQEMQAATEVIIAGFGDDDVSGTSGEGVKRSVTVPILFCSGGRTDGAVGNIVFDKNLEFVAGGPSAGACFGDSGGPAYITVDGVRKVAGVVSRPPDTQHPVCSGITILTRIDVHQGWILSQI